MAIQVKGKKDQLDYHDISMRGIIRDKSITNFRQTSRICVAISPNLGRPEQKDMCCHANDLQEQRTYSFK